MSDLTDNVVVMTDALNSALARALEMCGGMAESYAKQKCPVGTPESTGIPGYIGGTLRNSITHIVEGDTVIVGSNVEYAPYVELGTGKHYRPAPDYIESRAEQGSMEHNQHPHPYLRPAFEDHMDEYRQIIERALRNG